MRILSVPLVDPVPVEVGLGDWVGLVNNLLLTSAGTIVLYIGGGITAGLAIFALLYGANRGIWALRMRFFQS